MRGLFFVALLFAAMPTIAGTYPGRPPTSDQWGPAPLPTVRHGNEAGASPPLAALPSDGVTVPPAATSPVSPQAGWTPPRPLNSHAVTPEDYPSPSVIAGEQGRTVLQYEVRADGTVGDVTITSSSGYARLDEASQAIVKRWRFAPATHDGKPAAITVKAVVVWMLHDYFDTAVEQSNQPLAFIEPDRSDYPPDALAAHEQGTTVIMVIVTKDGAIGNLVLCRPSGHPRLDQAAMSLALGKWHPTPATVAGKPVQTMLMLVVRWQLRTQ